MTKTNENEHSEYGFYGFRPWGRGQAYRRGFGWARGWRNCQRQPTTVQFTQEEEKKILEAELTQLEIEKNQIEKRLLELEEKT